MVFEYCGIGNPSIGNNWEKWTKLKYISLEALEG